MTQRADVIRILNLYYGVALDELVNAVNEVLDYKELYTKYSKQAWSPGFKTDEDRYQKEYGTTFGDTNDAAKEDTPDAIKDEVKKTQEFKSLLPILVILALVLFVVSQ
jgi:hypothetical protein